MAARPGWNRVSPGVVLAGYLPDEFAYRAHAGLSHPSHKPQILVRLYDDRVLRTQLLCQKRCVPPDFLRSFVALAKFMRLSLVKAAHAVVSSAAYRKSGFLDRRLGLLFE